MGKKRIITKAGSDLTASSNAVHLNAKASKRQVLRGIINISSSYNNTLVSVADLNGEVFIWSSAGSMGFKGARKSTPYAATLVARDAVEKAKNFGLQEVRVSVSGIGPGREAAIRGVASSGINITGITDKTPVPHNGVRAPKPRRV